MTNFANKINMHIYYNGQFNTQITERALTAASLWFDLLLLLLCPCPGCIKRWWCCLTSVAYIRSAGGVCGRPAGWRVLADRTRLCRPGSKLPLRASVAGLGGAYCGGRPSTACYRTSVIYVA